MNNQQKKTLCDRHWVLLHLILKYGHGAMTLVQLRGLCLGMGLYNNEQAVNRAVRSLRAAGVLERQTSFTGNGDLIVGKKFLWRYFQGCSSQQAATPPRPNTMRPYIHQARKIGWLLAQMERNGLDTFPKARNFIQSQGCTMFLGLGELLDYYNDHRGWLSSIHPNVYEAEVRALEASTEQRRTMSHAAPTCGPPAVTLETLHRKKIYITGVYPDKRAVGMVMFPYRNARAERIVRWEAEAAWWARSLMGYSTWMVLEALDAPHAQMLRAELTRPTGRDGVSYCRDALNRQGLSGYVHLTVRDSDFVRRWCGGRQSADF